MGGDPHLAALRDFAARGPLITSEATADALAADIWTWRLRRDDMDPVLSDGAVFVSETAQDDLVVVRLEAPEVALTLRYERGVPAAVWIAPTGARSREFSVGPRSSPEVMDAPTSPPTLDHVGGASPIQPPSPETSPRTTPAASAPPGEQPRLRPHSLDLTALREVLAELVEATAVVPERERIASRHLTLMRCIAALRDAPPSESGDPLAVEWIGVRDDKRVIVASPDIYAVIAVDATSAELTSGSVVWQVDTSGASARVRALHGDATIDRTVLPSGDVIDHDPPPWRATHTVGADPAAVGGVPTGTFAPGTVLDPGLEVRVLDTTAHGWALVECSNGWQCYVAAHSLRPLE